MRFEAESVKSRPSEEVMIMNILDPRARRTRQALINAGLTLFIKNPDAKLTDVAQLAEVGRATLYRQFDTKESLLEAIALECIERFDKAFKPIDKKAKSAADAIRLLFFYSLPLTNELQFLTQLESYLSRNSKLMKVYEEQRQEMAELVEEAKSEGDISTQMPTDWIIEVIDSLIYSLYVTRQRQAMTDEQAADLAFATLMKGVAA